MEAATCSRLLPAPRSGRSFSSPTFVTHIHGEELSGAFIGGIMESRWNVAVVVSLTYPSMQQEASSCYFRPGRVIGSIHDRGQSTMLALAHIGRVNVDKHVVTSLARADVNETSLDEQV